MLAVLRKLAIFTSVANTYTNVKYSGAEGVVLDDQQTPNRIVWGLPGKEADTLSTNTHSSNQAKHLEPEFNMGSSDFQQAKDFRKPDPNIPSTKAVNTKVTSFALAKVRSTRQKDLHSRTHPDEYFRVVPLFLKANRLPS